MKRFTPVVIILSAILIFFAVVACTNQPAEQKAKPKKKETTDEGSGTGVLMLGRSVMAGWFQHWETDTSETYTHDGFTLYYRELDGPPEIANSAIKAADQYQVKVMIVFFKFCFVDFDGGSRSDAERSLLRNKSYVAKVYDAVVKQFKKKLVIGNALPQVRSATTPDLVWNHEQYNKWLNEFAKEHPGEVFIFDQYSILADSEGNLKKEYATSSDDSHPNDQGYAALDGPLFDLLKTLKAK